MINRYSSVERVKEGGCFGDSRFGREDEDVFLLNDIMSQNIELFSIKG
jgi:hypothetical protein